jgi:hypothetical protein
LGDAADDPGERLVRARPRPIAPDHPRPLVPWQPRVRRRLPPGSLWQERAVNRSGRYVRWYFTNPTKATVLGEIGEAQVFVE